MDLQPARKSTGWKLAFSQLIFFSTFDKASLSSYIPYSLAVIKTLVDDVNNIYLNIAKDKHMGLYFVDIFWTLHYQDIFCTLIFCLSDMDIYRFIWLAIYS